MSVDSIPVAEAAVDQPAADYPDSDTGFVKPAPDSVQTDTVNLSGSTNYVQARLVNVDKGSIGHLRGEAITVTLKNSIIGAATADVFDGVFDQGVIAALTARKAKLSGGQVTLLAAGKVELESGARVLFDLRAGLLAGLLAGGIFSIAYSVWRLLGARRG